MGFLKSPLLWALLSISAAFTLLCCLDANGHDDYIIPIILVCVLRPQDIEDLNAYFRHTVRSMCPT